MAPSGNLRNRGKRQPSPSVTEAVSESGSSIQLSMFRLDDPVLIRIRDMIRDLDINSLTPLEALNTLNEIKKSVMSN